jgi:hypothetical protein
MCNHDSTAIHVIAQTIRMHLNPLPRKNRLAVKALATLGIAKFEGKHGQSGFSDSASVESETGGEGGRGAQI